MDDEPLGDLDLTRPSLARVWNHVLGGKDNYEADREVAGEMIKALPGLPAMTLTGERFRFRAVRYLAGCGTRQFLDLGVGLPGGRRMPVHEIAQEVEPAARVVYVDDDPLVAAHCRAVLVTTSTAAGRAAFVRADIGSPTRLLDDPELTEVLDLRRPVAVLATVVLACFDDDTAGEIVATLLGALPAGSHLVVGHPSADVEPDAMHRAMAAARGAGLPLRPRTRERVTALLDGLELVEPGVVPPFAWRPAVGGDRVVAAWARRRAPCWVGVGRKP